jgi:hypothetical protein
MIAFKDKADGYYQFDWDGVSELPEWTKGMTQTDVVEPKVVPPTYAELRSAEYPSLADQADMQYWDKVNGTNTWETSIAAIKAKYPK